MPDPELDAQLRAFLEHNSRDQRNGNTIANVRSEMHQLQVSFRGMNGRVSSLETNLEEVNSRLDNHGASIVVLKRHARKNGADDDRDELDTGNYDLESIRREVERARARESLRVRAETENVVWWKRSIIMWVVGSLGVIAVTLFTALVTLAIANATAPQHAAPATAH